MFLTYAVLIPLSLLLYIAYEWISSVRRPQHFPPGPHWLPVIGNTQILKNMSKKLGGQHLALGELAKEFNTNVLGLKLGKELVVAVFSYETVRKVLTREEFEGRPDSFFIRLRCLGKRRGVTCVDGPLWTEQRSFVVKHLRNLGFGKRNMEVLTQEELAESMLKLQSKNKNVKLNSEISVSVINVLWKLVTGSKISRNDARLQKFLDLLYRRSKAFDMAGGTLNQFPWLRYLIPEKIGYNLLLKLNEELQEFMIDIIEDHEKNWYPDRQDDLIYTYITQMKEAEKESKPNTYTKDQLLMICLDMFIAGSNTTSNTLDFVFLSMLLYPDIQEKCARVLNDNFSRQEYLNYSDRLEVPYVEAVIAETQRMFGAVPITGPRRVLRATTLEGYEIPKETTVLISNYSVHQDKDYWGDPEVFKPERFIDADGKFVPNERVIPYGLGKRRCLGDLLARQCIFMFFGEIVRRYKICPAQGTKMPSSRPMPGIVLSPEPYAVDLLPRQTFNYEGNVIY